MVAVRLGRFTLAAAQRDDERVFDPAGHPRRVNLGCGFDRREGYLNVDFAEFHEPDLLCDVTDLAPLPTGYYDEVLALDVLEHIPRHRCISTLQEWNRILRKDGLMHLQVPNLLGLFDLMSAPDRQDLTSQEELNRCLFGTQAYTGDVHLNGFTEVTLTARLHAAGFVIEELRSRDVWLFDVAARKTADSLPDPLLKVDGDEPFVDGAYAEILGRAPDPQGRDYFLDQLARGTDRSIVLTSLRESTEAKVFAEQATAASG